jgi:ubiquinone/menaquinone biosynthesis C-methylase UbiE
MNRSTHKQPRPSEVDRLKRVYRGYAGHAAGKWSRENVGNLAMLAERYRVIEEMLAAAAMLPLGGTRILDVGCGTGQLLARFAELGAHPDALYGVDLMPDRIEAARATLSEAHFDVGNAEAMDFADEQFDLVVLSTVLSSILDDRMRRNVVAEVMRVTAQRGAVLIYDFRVPSPTNRQVRALSRRDLGRLFAGWHLQARSLTVVPPVTRRLGRATERMYGWLAAMPFLRTHNMVLLRRTLQQPA